MRSGEQQRRESGGKERQVLRRGLHHAALRSGSAAGAATAGPGSGPGPTPARCERQAAPRHRHAATPHQAELDAVWQRKGILILIILISSIAVAARLARHPHPSLGRRPQKRLRICLRLHLHLHLPCCRSQAAARVDNTPAAARRRGVLTRLQQRLRRRLRLLRRRRRPGRELCVAQPRGTAALWPALSLSLLGARLRRLAPHGPRLVHQRRQRLLPLLRQLNQHLERPARHQHCEQGGEGGWEG